MSRPKTYNKEDVCLKAMFLFRKYGYEGTTLSRLVEHTGINRHSLYGEFGGKSKLFISAMELYTSHMVEVRFEILKKAPLGLENIHNFFLRLIKECTEDGCLTNNTIIEKNIAPIEAVNIAKNTQTKLEKLITNNLKTAQQCNEISANKNLVDISKLMVVSFNGLYASGKVYQSTKYMQQAVNALFALLEK